MIAQTFSSAPVAVPTAVSARRARAALLGRRAARTVVRADNNQGKTAVEQAEKAFQEQAEKVQEGAQDALQRGREYPQEEQLNAFDNTIKEAGKKETEALGTQISIPDALRFKGVGPEHINSRLAMIGVTTGYLTKLLTGKNTIDQYAAAPLPVILTFFVFITASLIPITKGVTPDKAQRGIWTVDAEISNGRLAMLGFVALIATDGWQWFSALQAAKGAALGR